jgi:heme A synthase
MVLRKYTYPAVEQPFFSDPRFFGLFVVGLIAGTLLEASNRLVPMNMIFMILFSVIQCLAMVVVMNLKRFHGKSDSVFYGYGLGLGMGCTMALGTIYFKGSDMFKIAEGAAIGIEGYAWFILIALSYVFIISALGTTVGEGVARLRPMEFGLQAIFVNVVFSLILWIAYSADESIALYICLILALMVAVAYFYYIMYVKLSGVVRDVLKMEGKTRKDIPR